jgi:hypothetical protein
MFIQQDMGVLVGNTAELLEQQVKTNFISFIPCKCVSKLRQLVIKLIFTTLLCSQGFSRKNYGQNSKVNPKGTHKLVLREKV